MIKLESTIGSIDVILSKDFHLCNDQRKNFEEPYFSVPTLVNETHIYAPTPLVKRKFVEAIGLHGLHFSSFAREPEQVYSDSGYHPK